MVLIVYQWNTKRNVQILEIQIFVITIILQMANVCGMVRIVSYLNHVLIYGPTQLNPVCKMVVILIPYPIHVEI